MILASNLGQTLPPPFVGKKLRKTLGVLKDGFLESVFRFRTFEGCVEGIFTHSHLEGVSTLMMEEIRREPLEVGRFHSMICMVLYIPGGCLGFNTQVIQT